MTLKEFLKEVNGKEEDIIEYKGEEALSEVKQEGDALRYVKEQTPEICLEAVKQYGDALQYVDKSIFEKNTIKELTVKEISNLLGYEIKIIK